MSRLPAFAALVLIAASLHAETIAGLPPAYTDAKGNIVFQPAGATAAFHLGQGYELAISRSGDRLLYTKNANPMPNREIYMVDAKGKPVKLLSGLVRGAVWSPDASQIAFLKSAPGEWQLWMMQAGHPESAHLVRAKTESIHGWNPDGKTILVSDDQFVRWVTPAGEQVRDLAIAKIDGQEFDWSSSNTYSVSSQEPNLLLVSADRVEETPGATKDADDRTSNVFLYDMATGKRNAVPSVKVWGSDAAWSRDGEWIYFRHLQQRHMHVARMKKDGSELTDLTAGEVFALP